MGFISLWCLGGSPWAAARLGQLIKNVAHIEVGLVAIPQIAAGIVPLVERYVIGPGKPAGVADDRFLGQAGAGLVERSRVGLALLMTAPGTHATILATFEGSRDGASWYNLLTGLLSQPFTGHTVDTNGLAMSVALAQAGAVLPVRASFPYYRVGLAGNDAAADGAGRVGIQLVRES